MLGVSCHVVTLAAAGHQRQQQLQAATAQGTKREEGGGKWGPGLRQSQDKVNNRGQGLRSSQHWPGPRACDEAGPRPPDRPWTVRTGSCQCEICTKTNFKVPNSPLIGNWSESKFSTNRLFSWMSLLLYISYQCTTFCSDHTQVCHNWERELQHGYRSYTVRPYLNVYSSMSRLHTVWGAGGGYLNSLQSRLHTDHTCLCGDSIILCQINDLPGWLAGWLAGDYLNISFLISHITVSLAGLGWAGLGWAGRQQNSI